MSDKKLVDALRERDAYFTEEARVKETLAVPPLSAPSCSAFRVKLLQLWSFERICGEDWVGIWETQSLHDQGTDKERWTLRRAFVTGDGQSLNDQRHNLPTWLLLQSGRCLKLMEVYTPNGEVSEGGPLTSESTETRTRHSLH